MIITKLRWYDPTPSNHWPTSSSFSYDNVLISSEQCTTSNNGFLGNLNQCGDTNGTNDLPNLTLSGFKVTVGSSEYDVYENSNNIPIFKNGEDHIFTITIENDGNGNTSSSPYELLVSKSQSNPYTNSNAQYYTFRNDNAGSIDGNSEESDSYSQYIYSTVAGMQLEANTDYYMHVVLDKNNNVNESNETDDDNWQYFKFKYEDDSSSRIAYLNLSSGTIIEIPLDNHQIQNLKIYNVYSSTLVVSQTIVENQTVNESLPHGTYAIHINDKYVKQFKVLRGMD